MKFIVNFTAASGGSYEVEAESADAAMTAFRAAGDQRHVFAANSGGAPSVLVESLVDVARGLEYFSDGRIRAYAKE